jgi:hypothetical protein
MLRGFLLALRSQVLKYILFGSKVPKGRHVDRTKLKRNFRAPKGRHIGTKNVS